MSFHPENKLEHSLIKAAEDPAHRPQFYKDFIESDIYIIQYGEPPEEKGRVTLKEGYQLKIAHIRFNGKSYIPIFSSLVQLQSTLKEEAGYIALNALEFIKITKGAEFILNPGADFGKEFIESEIASIIDGSIWKPVERFVAQKETQVFIGQPSNYPQELVDVLKRVFNKNKEVKRAYLGHFMNPKRDEKAHTLIALEVSGEWEKIMSEVGIVARDIKIPDPPIDFIQITGKGGIEDYFLKECKTFYVRKLFGLF